MKAMYGTENTMYGGLFPVMWDLNTGKPNQSAFVQTIFVSSLILKAAEFSASGCADSAYEYFLKQWLMTGQKEPKTRDLCASGADVPGPR